MERVAFVLNLISLKEFNKRGSKNEVWNFLKINKRVGGALL